MPILLWPQLGNPLATATLAAAERADKLGFEHVALRGAGLVFGMEYFRGMRKEAGSLARVSASCVGFLRKAATSKRPVRGAPRWLARTVVALADGALHFLG
jgi:hypothetical protein